MLITVVATGICIAIGIVAYNSFEESLDTLLILLSYWLCIYCVILVEGAVSGSDLAALTPQNTASSAVAALRTVPLGL